MQNTAQQYTMPALESPAEWAALNGIELPNDGKQIYWNTVCEALKIDRPKTKSGKVAITEWLYATGNIRTTNNNNPQPQQPMPQQTTTNAAQDNLAAILAKSIEGYMNPQNAQINEDRVIELIKSYAPTKETRVTFPDRVKVVEGTTHKQFDQIVMAIAAGQNVWLTGSAGSGKTTVCEQVADALDLNFFCMSVCAQTTKSDLFGYMNASGEYVTTVFRTAFEQGGLFLLDEVDNGNANVLAALNSALANGYCSFPDGMVKKSENFQIIAAGNTFGTGANRMYVGRNQIDAATLDRFCFIEFEIDEALETAVSGNPEWAAKVQKARKALQGERIIISPRATINGAKLLAAGFKEAEVIRMAICKGCNADIAAKVVNAMKAA